MCHTARRLLVSQGNRALPRSEEEKGVERAGPPKQRETPSVAILPSSMPMCWSPGTVSTA